MPIWPRMFWPQHSSWSSLRTAHVWNQLVRTDFQVVPEATAPEATAPEAPKAARTPQTSQAPEVAAPATPPR